MSRKEKKRVTNVSDFLVSDSDVETIEIEVDGGISEWKIRKPTYIQKTHALSKALIPNAKGMVFELDLGAYYRELMEKCVVSAPWGELKSTQILGLKPEVGEKLQRCLPGPFTMEVDDEMKKKLSGLFQGDGQTT